MNLNKLTILFLIYSFFESVSLYADKMIWEHYLPNDDLGVTFNHLHFDNNSKIWAITYKALSKGPTKYFILNFDGKNWENFATDSYDYVLADTIKIYNIISDMKGNIFTGGKGAIAKLNKDKKWEKLFFDDSLNKYRVYQYFALDSIGNVWITAIGYIPFKQFSDGTWWYKNFVELFKYDGKSLSKEIFSNTYENEYNYGFTAIACSKTNKVWLGYRQGSEDSKGGLIEFDGTNMIFHKLESFHNENFPRWPKKIAIDEDFIWISYLPYTWEYRAYTGGLSKYDSKNKIWKHYTKEDNLPFLSDKHIDVNDIFIDKEKNKWIATQFYAAKIVGDTVSGIYRPWSELGLDTIYPFPIRYQTVSQGIGKSVIYGTNFGLFKYNHTKTYIAIDYQTEYFYIEHNQGQPNIYIKFKKICDNNIFISIYNLLGIPIYQSNFTITPNSNSITINFNSLVNQSGIYFIAINYCKFFKIKKLIIIK